MMYNTLRLDPEQKAVMCSCGLMVINLTKHLKTYRHKASQIMKDKKKGKENFEEEIILGTYKTIEIIKVNKPVIKKPKKTKEPFIRSQSLVIEFD